MAYTDEIRDGIVNLAKSAGMHHWRDSVFSAEVSEVDEANRTCSVISISDKAETTYTGVRLMATKDDGWLCVPTIGSTVYVQSLPNLDPFIIMFSQLDKVVQIVGDTEISMKNGNLQIMQDKTVITLSNGKLNIQNDNADLLTVFTNLITHLTALTVPTPSGNSGVPLNITDFENDLTDLKKLLQ